jgi:hypothetical protein
MARFTVEIDTDRSPSFERDPAPELIASLRSVEKWLGNNDIWPGQLIAVHDGAGVVVGTAVLV